MGLANIASSFNQLFTSSVRGKANPTTKKWLCSLCDPQGRGADQPTHPSTHPPTSKPQIIQKSLKIFCLFLHIAAGLNWARLLAPHNINSQELGSDSHLLWHSLGADQKAGQAGCMESQRNPNRIPIQSHFILPTWLSKGSFATCL